MKLKNYIIGYGSLMNLSSLNRTLPNVKHIEPIYLKNFKRAWNAIENKTKTLSTTYLGIEKESGSSINCIIFEIPKDELLYMDQREFLYSRDLVEINDIDSPFNRSSFQG